MTGSRINGARKTGSSSNYNNSGDSAENPNAFLEFFGMLNSKEPPYNMYLYTFTPFFKMANTKPEVVLTTVVAVMASKYEIIFFRL